ncbi:unnamed protein product, partial [Staurois parvus]
MVRVTSQESNRRSQQRSGSGWVGNKSGRNRNASYKIQGPMENHTPRHGVWPSLKYTTCNQPQVMANCRSEPLVVESTRCPALVLQPTRQVSPTTIGKSIPDNYI